MKKIITRLFQASGILPAQTNQLAPSKYIGYLPTQSQVHAQHIAYCMECTKYALAEMKIRLMEGRDLKVEEADQTAREFRDRAATARTMLTLKDMLELTNIQPPEL